MAERDRARTTMRVMTITPKATGKPFLIVEIAGDCPACGEYEIHLAGHHVAHLAALLAQVVREHPGMVGEVGRLEGDPLVFEADVVPGKETLN